MANSSKIPIRSHHLATTHSTNSQLIDEILASVKNGKPIKNFPHFSQPFLLTADSQTNGRGQHGRQWQSPLGNVYLSLYIPTRAFADDDTTCLAQQLDGRLSLCVGYQLKQLPQLADINKIGVKWVNDLGFYAANQFNKLAGILIEPVILENQLLGVVVGLGMNINSAPSLNPQTKTNLNYKAVSLQELVGGNLRPQDYYEPISQAILQAIGQFNGFNDPSNMAEFLQSFHQVDSLWGKNLQITLSNNDRIFGTAHGIDTNGCLQILHASGTMQAIWTGTIQVL